MQSTSTDLGLSVQTLTPELARQLNYGENQKGAVVREVTTDGVAARAGLEPEQIIVSVNDREVTDARSFQNAVSEQDLTRGFRLQVLDGAHHRFVFLKSR